MQQNRKKDGQNNDFGKKKAPKERGEARAPAVALTQEVTSAIQMSAGLTGEDMGTQIVMILSFGG